MKANHDQDVKLVECSCCVCLTNDSRPERILRGYSLSQCRKCGFVFMNPQYSESDINSFYEERPESELVSFYEQITSQEELQSFEDELRLLEGFEPPARLLDFGCGAGYCYEIAISRGWEGHGLEIGKWARLAAERRNLPDMHIGHLSDQGFEKGSFDAVVSNDVFEHLQDPACQLREIHEVLKPGGHLALQVPNYGALAIRLNRDHFTLNEPPQHVNYFTSKSLSKLLRRCGFRTIHVSTWGGFKFDEILGRKPPTAYASERVVSEKRSADHEPLAIDQQGSKPGFRRLIATPLYRWWGLGAGLRVIARKEPS